jgi:twitching motility protein PilT
VVRDLVQRPAGLVLVTGPTGAGKTTALNAMVDWINSERRSRIVTIEDPIEYLHAHKRSVVIQRELDDDTYSFQGALMAALRQDPNVICLGEMRSLETVATALTAAETGHLVLGTLHTQGCCQTIERIVDVFPTSQHNQVRTQLASTLQGIVSLQLLPRMAERGRVLACEVMVGTMAVKNIIRTGKIEQLSSLIQTGGEDGMVSMDRCLRRLYESGVISYETALSRAHNQNEFRALRAVAV